LEKKAGNASSAVVNPADRVNCRGSLKVSRPSCWKKFGVEIGAHRIIDGMSQEVHIGIGD
jgi:hypothetical protein